MSYTDQEKMQEFERLKDFLESLDLAAEILPKGNVLDDIILLVSLPSIRRIFPSDREATEADLHLAAGYLMDLDDTDQRLCKYLLFYSQIIVDLAALTSRDSGEHQSAESERSYGTLFLWTGRWKRRGNAAVPGHGSPGQEDQPLDEGTVADALLEMGVGYDIALHTFQRAAHK